MRYCLLVLALIVPFLVKAQVKEIDSLQNILRGSGTDEKKIKALNRLSFLYYRISLDKSEQYAKRALDLALPLNQETGMADAYNNMGICASIRGMHSEGLDFFFKALKLRESTRNNLGAARTLNNIAGIYLYQSDFDKAISYSEQSLERIKKENDPQSTGDALVFLATIFTEKKDTSTALSYYFQALNEFGQLTDKRNEVHTLIKIGILEKDNEKEKILAASLSALKNLNDQSDFVISIDLYKTIAEIYIDMNQLLKAQKYYHKALTLARRYYDNQEQMKIKLGLSALFEKDKQYDSAMWYYKAYADLNEKTYSAEKSSQLVILGKLYETEKKDQLIESGKQEIRSQSVIIAAISAMLLLLLVSGVVLYRYYRQKRQANVQLQQLISAITSQARELQIANNEIKRINEHLEEEVSKRTEKIQIQNEKLIEYAYFNSHEVRGPVARILGLADLMKKNPSTDDVMDMSQRIQLAAKELDTVIREINKKLETEE